MDKAKKALKAEGFDFDAVAQATPKATPKKAAGGKRKAKGDDDEDDEEASPTKKGKKEGVKIKDGFKDEDDTE